MAGSTSALQQVTAIATIIIAVALVVLACLAVAIALRVRVLSKRVNALLDDTRSDLVHIVNRTRAASDDIATMTTTVRRDVDRVQGLVNSASDRVEDALHLAERELSEFSALLAVAREEAEDLFVSAAATVRGVRRGVETGTRAFRRSNGTDLASDEPDAAMTAAGDLTTQEEGNVHDYDSESAAEAIAPSAPRIRPRARNRRPA